jgi:hypothetical protein
MFTTDLSDAFFDAARATATALRCDPVDLLAVMMAESGVSAAAHDPATGAAGLLLFPPRLLANLGWPGPGATFRELPAQAQLPYVRRYLQPYADRTLRPAARLYQTVFLPATLVLGSDPATVICGRDGPFAFAYEPNRAFDTAGTGAITVADLQSTLDRACRGPRWSEILFRLHGVFQPDEDPDAGWAHSHWAHSGSAASVGSTTLRDRWMRSSANLLSEVPSVRRAVTFPLCARYDRGPGIVRWWRRKVSWAATAGSCWSRNGA